MKVLFIAGADQQYGTFHMSKLLLEYVKKNDNKIEYIVLTQKHGLLNEWCDCNAIENYVFPYRYCVYHPSSSFLKRSIKHFTKQVLITISNRIALFQLEKSGILKEIDIVHTNINRDLFGVLISKKYNLPNIIHLREFSRTHFGLKPLYKNQIELMNKYSSRFIAISDAVKEEWIDYGLQGDKIEVIYDGVEVDKYRTPEEARKKIAQLRIVMCGAIYEGKGQKELIVAVFQLIEEGLNVCVDIYGSSASDKYLNEIMNYVEENGIQSSVRFLGYKDNLNEVLNNYDIGIVCSKAEGFGLVTVEYLLSGLVVIASDTGANPELLGKGKYGLLYKSGDVESLKSAIRFVYSNRAENALMLKTTRTYAEEKYTINKTAKLTSRLFNSVIEEYRYRKDRKQ